MRRPPASAARDAGLLLADLLASRLCHDLSGAVGTVSGALDLAADDPDFAAEALGVAAEAARGLAARLRLLRAAWGRPAPALTLEDLRSLMPGLPGEGVRGDLRALAGSGPIAPPAGRVLLNVLLLAAGSLPRGGVIGCAGDLAEEVVVTITGPQAAWPPGLAIWLTDANAAWDALGPRAGSGAGAATMEPAWAEAVRGMQGKLTALVAHQAGLRVAMLLSSGAAGGAAPPPLLVSMTEES